MAVPKEQQIKKFKPPAWMVKKAQADAARTGLAPNALATKLQDIKDNPEEAKTKAKEHANKMGVDLGAAAAKMMAAARKASPTTMAERPKQPPKEQPKVVEREESRTASAEQDVATSCEVVMLPTGAQPVLPQQTKVDAQKPAPSKRRETQVEKRDDRRAKKEKARIQQAKVSTKKNTPNSAFPASDPSSSITAKSSTTGAALNAKKTIEPTPMDIDHSPSLFVEETNRYPVRATLPGWYISIKDTSFQMVQLSKKRTPELTSLESLKNCIGRCEAEKKKPKLNQLYEELRDHVHKAEITVKVDRFMLKKARILHPENGLPRIFKEDANFPSDLKADAYLLYSRWYKEDFSQDILRGVVTVKGKDRNGDRLDASYRKKYPADAKFYGEGDLVLGQWWPTQLVTVRDGAHGTPQGGIFGNKEHGTYSVVLSGGGYHDKDECDIIEYSGTEGKNFTPTDATLAMLKSAELGNEIRVIRSSMLPKTNAHRPEVGLRYDGLYQIKSSTLVDKPKQMYRFRLERCPGQGRIRSENNASGRPTQFEVAKFRQLKEKDW